MVSIIVGSGVVGLGHYDGTAVDEGITHMVNKILELSIGHPEVRLELSVVGGFTDNRGCSEEIGLAILRK